MSEKLSAQISDATQSQRSAASQAVLTLGHKMSILNDYYLNEMFSAIKKLNIPFPGTHRLLAGLFCGVVLHIMTLE